MVTIAPSSRVTTYNPTTSTATFAVNFPIFDNSDIVVTVNDDVVINYTVAATYIEGTSTDASITLSAGVTGVVEIMGSRTPARTDQFQTGRPLSIPDLNYSLNRLEIEMQEAHRDGSTKEVTVAMLAAIAKAEEAAAQAATVAATFVSSIADLKALDTTKSITAYLRQSGLEGFFVWRTGNFSSQIATDTVGGVFVKANAIATTVGAWVRVTNGILRPEWFGAVGDASTDDTAALQVFAAVANLMVLPVLKLQRIYKKTAVLAFTSDSFQMEGVGSGSGFLNANCDGFTLTQAFRWATLKIADFVNLTDQVNTKIGFAYNNTTATTVTDGVVTRTVEAISSMGYGRWTNFASGLGGWLNDFKITNGDGFHFKNCLAWGDNNELATGAPFPAETCAYYSNAGTDVVFENCQACIRKYGIYGTGQSESNRVYGGDYIECYNCIDYSTVVSPSNDTCCLDVDLYFYHVGIDLGSAMGTTHEETMGTIMGCLLFWASNVLGAGSMSAQYIRLNGYGNQVTGNYFYCADNTAGTYHTICVNLYAGNDGFSPPIGNTITGNVFYHQYKALNVQSTVQGTVFAGNTFIDDPADLTTAGVNPVTNNSTYPVYYGQNFGDRSNYCDYTFFNDGGQTFGTKSGKAFAVTNVAGTTVNYTDVIPAITGSPPQVRARGSDANVDLKLTPQGTGNVTTGAAFRTGGNSADPAFLQSTGVTANSAGLISAFASAGESLHLGTATGTRVAQFGYAGSIVGSIGIGASSVTYNTSSDRRLKEEIVDLDPSAALEFINSLKPRSFTMRGQKMTGFIADEFQEVSPQSVTGEKDAEEEIGTATGLEGETLDNIVVSDTPDGWTWVKTGTRPVYQSMQASTAEVIANFTAVVQLLVKKVEALEGVKAS
ncbi:tail fiber domain-containing protein [Rhizobium rhizogenes]|uniref:tail fiber domain-containing protein n=1 Tax=Rhizobium rhizogenes TaxID=359 RepID=UPI0024BE4C3E|nr:tail fiber domain-containing protein [Rhizobium rhizogenes]MDJ1633200.1 tail fiber domain-containing protein [Rhizobium rhizogenes]